MMMLLMKGIGPIRSPIQATPAKIDYIPLMKKLTPSRRN